FIAWHLFADRFYLPLFLSMDLFRKTKQLAVAHRLLAHKRFGRVAYSGLCGFQKRSGVVCGPCCGIVHLHSQYFPLKKTARPLKLKRIICGFFCLAAPPFSL